MPGQPPSASPPAAGITVSLPGHDGHCAQAPIDLLHAGEQAKDAIELTLNYHLFFYEHMIGPLTLPITSDISGCPGL